MKKFTKIMRSDLTPAQKKFVLEVVGTYFDLEADLGHLGFEFDGMNFDIKSLVLPSRYLVLAMANRLDKPTIHEITVAAANLKIDNSTIRRSIANLKENGKMSTRFTIPTNQSTTGNVRETCRLLKKGKRDIFNFVSFFDFIGSRFDEGYEDLKVSAEAYSNWSLKELPKPLEFIVLTMLSKELSTDQTVGSFRMVGMDISETQTLATLETLLNKQLIKVVRRGVYKRKRQGKAAVAVMKAFAEQQFFSMF